MGMFLRVRKKLCAGLLLCVAVAATVLPAVEASAQSWPEPQGSYVMTTTYTGSISDTRGWKIEWRTPTVSNPGEAWGAIGTWYYNLEAGLYRSPSGWSVYYFGDDNGLDGNHPSCARTWASGGGCGGSLGGFGAGKRVYFKYEWCTLNKTGSLTGNYLCLYVDMENGAGWEFLAQDTRGTAEMYAHDMETFEPIGYPRMMVPCSNIPTKMIQQQRKRTDGTWANLGGAWWTFGDYTSNYKFQNISTGVTPSHWESCDQ